MPSHRRSDPVELLLKRIAQRALAGTLMGGLALAAGCADAEPSTASDLDEATDPSEQPTSPRLDPGRLRWSRRRPRPSRDAAVPPQDAGDAGVRDAGPSVPPEARGVACASDARFPVNAAGLQTSASFDSLQIRRVQGVFDPPDAGGGWADIPFERLSETGEPCRTATTPACSTQVARHPSELVAVRCADICSELSVVTTAGDEVKRWARPEEVRALLGPIDTVDEALLLVSVAGYDIRCNDPVRTAVRPLEDGFEVFATRMTNACAPIVITRYRLHVGRDGALRVLEQAELERDERACVGRRPDGYAPEGRGRADSLAAYLGDCAELEAASVAAFARLSRELEAHGAPSELVARARSSEADEVRHARTVGALARARGVEPHEPVLAGGDVRSLEEIALENAVEGCVPRRSERSSARIRPCGPKTTHCARR